MSGKRPAKIPDKIKNILVSGGGTGGHLMPAIAIAEILIKNGYNPTLITDSRCINYLPTSLNFEVKIFDLFRPTSFRNLFKFFLSFENVFRNSYRIYKTKNIKLLVACGGYSSIPVILAAFFARVKIVLHEQNSVVGRTNYWFSYIADKLFLSFMHTVRIPLINQKKIVWVGIPVMEKHKIPSAEIQIQNNQEANNQIKGKKEVTILVTGGSQAARVFDELIIQSIKLLANNMQDMKFNIIQQVSTKDLESIENEYKKLRIDVIVSNFFHNLEDHYKKADLFIGRAGASTINEIIKYSIPSILIPYPFAKDNHQYYNAKNLVEFSAAWLLDQKKATAEKLQSIIQEIISSDSMIISAKKQLSKLQIDSDRIIASEIKKIIDK